ncbi:hypothetical protein EB001_02105 [bacterium]|nr:hypothetical protein [bacterium]
MANLTQFKGKIGYGIRPNLFQVSIPTAPTATTLATSYAENFTFLCRSAGIPASSVGTVEVPFRGRVIKLPGDRTFEAWTITIFGDENLKLRSYFEKWLDVLNEHTSGAGYTNSANYSATLQVDQLFRGSGKGSQTGNEKPHSVIRSYQFINSFPTNVSQIDLSYDNNNSIAEYTVEFQYDYWITSAVSNGTATIGNDTI